MGREIDYSFTVFEKKGDPKTLEIVRLRDGHVSARFSNERQDDAMFMASVLSASSKHFGDLQYNRGYSAGCLNAQEEYARLNATIRELRKQLKQAKAK